MKYRALIVGLGRMGMGYDYLQSSGLDYLVLSHAQALNTHTKFELVGGVDVSMKCRNAFFNKFKKPSFKTFFEASKLISFDLVVICTNTDSHLETFKAVLKYSSPKLILIEKPIALTTAESFEIVRLSRKSDIPVAVNYFRAYQPGYQIICSQLQDGHFGFPINAVVRYTNGLINNGSHFLQLLLPTLKKYIDIEYASLSPAIDGDILGDLKLNFEQGSIHFISCEHTNYYLFEIDIYGPLGKMVIDNSGRHVKFFFAKSDSIFQDALGLEESTKIINLNTRQYQMDVYNNVAEFLDGEATLDCSLESIVDVLDIYSKIRKRLKANQ